MGFLSDDNAYNRLMTKVFDLCLLSVLTIIMCIPIITVGASITAMYSVMMKMNKNIEGSIIKSFMKEFKDNFKCSIPGSLIIIAGVLVLTLDLSIWTQNEVNNRSLFYGFTLALIVLFIAVMDWFFVIRARFIEKNIQSIINSIKFAIVYFHLTLICGLYTVLFVVFVTRFAFLLIALPIIGVGVLYYPKACLLGKKIDKYIEDNNLLPESDNIIPEREYANYEIGLPDSEYYFDTEKDNLADGIVEENNNPENKWNEMSFKDKLSYILYNHMEKIVIITIAVSLIGGLGYHFIFKARECVFNLAVINGYYTDSDIELSDGLNDYYGVDGKRKYAYIDSEYQLSYEAGGKAYENPAANTSFFDKLFLNIRAGSVDAAIVPESFFEYCNSQENIFYDVEFVLSKEQKDEYKDYFVTGETEEGKYVNGIDISKSEYIDDSELKFVDINKNESYILVFPVNGSHRKECRKFVEYLGLK